MNHTLQLQLAEQNAKIDDLTTLVRQLALKGLKEDTADSQRVQQVQHAEQVNNGPVTQVITNNHNHSHTNNITIRPWSSEEKIVIPATMLRAAFTENQRLVEYCRLSDEDKTDAETAAPYVLEALVDLVKRAHADPTARNVYINPKRADQVMVFDEATWRVLTLVDAIRGLFDSVAGNIHRIIVTDAERAKLPQEVQASASWIPNLYEDEPTRYVGRAKASMSAHLANVALQLDTK